MTARIEPAPAVDTLGDFVAAARAQAAQQLQPARRTALGQFFTPGSVATLMASLSRQTGETVRLLDPGAGIGVLAAAWIHHACTTENPPRRVCVTAYELDTALVPALTSVLEKCREYAAARQVEVEFTIHQEDFIRAAVAALNGGLFGSSWPRFDAVIMNPPYRKFRTESSERALLREVGLETSNLYTAFVALALRALTTGGELIAITPRSFCNGPYFTPFRRDLLALGSLTHMHVFDSRSSAFGDADVLQENVVFRAERARRQGDTVQVEWSESGEREHTTRRLVPFSQVVRPGDPDVFIHIAPHDSDSHIANLVRSLRGSLETLGIKVSTGRVVDFRAREQLRDRPSEHTVPLIYPTHFADGRIAWPKADSRKPNALLHTVDTEPQLNPTGTYVLVKRFSAKEEKRRLVAAVFTPDAAPGEFVAFENHLNYFHRHGRTLTGTLATGLAAYLNSTLVDSYFRQFNGHTQVNATDLRKLPYPTAEQLERIADLASGITDQSELDDIVEGELLDVSEKPSRKAGAQRRINEAVEVLKVLGLPKEQTNERAALTLLALLDLKPRSPWSTARAPLRGVTPIMEFAAVHYGKHWKPNTRETVRRFTLHQFQDAGLVIPNPDKPERPVNSPAYCYQVPEVVLTLLKSFGTASWDGHLERYLADAVSLAESYARERKMTRIPLRVGEGQEISISPGGQNQLIALVLTEFCPRFTPGAKALYIGDAGSKWGFVDRVALKELGITVNAHGKMPDVVVHHVEKNWLVLIEVVTSHGPVNPKRHGELKRIFKRSSAPLVFVTAFRSRQSLNRHLPEIAWETEVWVAESPSHMIHFNGERFLGPYEED